MERPRSSSPLAEKNTVRRMPSRCARAFMTRTNPSSLPAIWIASASAASLADPSIIAYRRFSTLIRSPALSPRVELAPYSRRPKTARGSTVTKSVGRVRSIVISAVMIFVRLAIGTGWSGAFSSRTWPDVSSARRADRAVSVGATVGSAGVASVIGKGDRLPCGGTGVGGGALPRGDASDVRAASPETTATTTIAVTILRWRTRLTRTSGAHGAHCATGLA